MRSSSRDCVDLYEASFEVKYLDAANELTEKMRELFEDKQAGAFLQHCRR